MRELKNGDSDMHAKWKIRAGKLKNLTSPMISFFFSVAILQLAYAFVGIYPYGKKTLLLIDMFHQYAPFMEEFIYKIHHAGSLFFSWSGGMGVSFFTTVAYYLASPLNILLLFFNESLLTEAILVLTLMKVGLAAAFFFLWIRETTGKDDFSGIAFSMMYALSGYVTAYAWNIMWLDGIYLMPLLMIGMDRIIRGRNALLYTFVLGLMLFANFYISFFAIIFLILYFPIMMEQREAFKGFKPVLHIFKRVVFFSLLGIALSAVLVLPTLVALRLTSAAGDTFPTAVSLYGDLFDYFARHFVDAKPSALDGMPNMYGGVIVLFFVPVFLLLPGETRKARIWSGVLLLFMIAGFNVNILDFIWHGMHFPNQLPFRNAYVYVFFTVTLAYRAYCRKERLSGRQAGLLLGALLLMVVLSQKLDKTTPSWISIYLTMGFLIVYSMILLKSEVSRRNVRDFAIFVVILAELTVNTFVVIGQIDKVMSYAPRDGYAAEGDVIQLRAAIESIRQKETGFYRMEVSPAKTVNDPFLYHYPGISIFSSMSSETTAKMMSRYGLHSNDVNSYKYSGSTILFDSILGLKYLIRRSGDENEQLRTNIATFGDEKVFLNPDALSIAFWAPNSIRNWSSIGKKPIFAHEGLAAALTGTGSLFRELPVQEMGAQESTISSDGAGTYAVNYPDKNKQAIVYLYMTVDEEQPIYLQYEAQPTCIGIGNILIGNKKISFDSTRNTIVDVGVVRKGEKVTIELWPNSRASGDYGFHLKAYGMDMNAYRSTMAILSDRQMTIDTFRDTAVGGNLDAKEDGVVFTTIPYDQGWTVKVDGMRTIAYAVDGGFLAFDVKTGPHRITMKFIPRFFLIGLEITLFCLMFLAVACLKRWGFVTGEPQPSDAAENV